MIWRFLDRLLNSLLFLTLVTMVTVVSANVFCRFLLSFSIYWGDELAQILLVWMTFLGAAVAVRDKGHYVFDYLVSRLPGKWRTGTMILGHLISIMAILLLLVYGAQVTLGIRTWIMPALEISRSFVYGACPIGCSFMLIYALRHLSHDVRNAAFKANPST